MTTIEILKKAKALELSSAPLTTEQKNTAIMLCADALCENAAEILKANAKDVENARGKISEVMIDRLRLDAVSYTHLDVYKRQPLDCP